MNRIILPLDGMTVLEAQELISRTRDLVWGYKINDFLYDRTWTRRMFSGAKLMVDPKLFDIPNTISNTLKRICNHLDPDIITVHCAAKYKPVTSEFARKIAGVTILTSSERDILDIEEEVHCMVREVAIPNKYKYIVCSGQDLEILSDHSIRKIVPGVRPAWYGGKDDQVRIITPAAAIAKGVELLVIGRPIYGDMDPAGALVRTNAEICVAEENLNVTNNS